VKGVGDFKDAISNAPPTSQSLLIQMTEWACGLEDEGLAVLYTSHGKGKKTLVPRVMGTMLAFARYGMTTAPTSAFTGPSSSA
jgi:hypothetical protein